MCTLAGFLNLLCCIQWPILLKISNYNWTVVTQCGTKFCAKRSQNNLYLLFLMNFYWIWFLFSSQEEKKKTYLHGTWNLCIVWYEKESLLGTAGGSCPPEGRVYPDSWERQTLPGPGVQAAPFLRTRWKSGQLSSSLVVSNLEIFLLGHSLAALLENRVPVMAAGQNPKDTFVHLFDTIPCLFIQRCVLWALVNDWTVNLVWV